MKNIGLVNINNRIKMHFSSAYGLFVESCPGTGTRALVSIPKWRGPETTGNGNEYAKNSHR
jgi:two-component system sensor histidine kinase YesM